MASANLYCYSTSFLLMPLLTLLLGPLFSCFLLPLGHLYPSTPHPPSPHSPPPGPTLSQHQMEQYQRDGFLILRKALLTPS